MPSPPANRSYFVDLTSVYPVFGIEGGILHESHYPLLFTGTTHAHQAQSRHLIDTVLESVWASFSDTVEFRSWKTPARPRQRIKQHSSPPATQVTVSDGLWSRWRARR